MNEMLPMDTNGDGTADKIGIDTNGDGYLDAFLHNLPQGGLGVDADTDFDGRLDTYAYDFNLDGVLDRIDVDPDQDGVWSTSDSIYPNGANLSSLSPEEVVAIGAAHPGPSAAGMGFGNYGMDPTGIVAESNRQMNELWIDPPLDSDNDHIPDGPDMDD